jgi:hypothetical protein
MPLDQDTGYGTVEPPDRVHSRLADALVEKEDRHSEELPWTPGFARGEPNLARTPLWVNIPERWVKYNASVCVDQAAVRREVSRRSGNVEGSGRLGPEVLSHALKLVLVELPASIALPENVQR